MKVKIILCLIILTLFSFSAGITYLYFHSSGIVVLDQKVAAFVFNVEKKDKLEIPLENLNPGESQVYDFSVSNTKDKTTSNVTIEYQMILKTYHFVPLVIELYKVGEETEELILTCDESFGRNEKNEVVCNAPLQELKYSEEALDNYKLKLTFPEKYNDLEYSNLVDFIDIEIFSYQKI